MDLSLAIVLGMHCELDMVVAALRVSPLVIRVLLDLINRLLDDRGYVLTSGQPWRAHPREQTGDTIESVHSLCRHAYLWLRSQHPPELW